MTMNQSNSMSRRSFFGFGQPENPGPVSPTEAATATKPGRAAKTVRASTPSVKPALTPISDTAFGYEQARHLLWRAGFGGTSKQIQTLVSWGPARAVDYLLSPEAVAFDDISPDQFDRDIMRPPSAEERRMYAVARRAQNEDELAKIRLMRQQREQQDRRQMSEVQKWWLKRMIETPRPLEEKMTLFWHGHFATNYRTIENSYHMFTQNQMLRKHALGNFGELLFAIIRDPAMLAYLDNNDSRKGRPNENLARELMELFSLGVGNYTERDIKEGARALTGYTFDDDQFVFQKGNHDEGPKSILGKSGPMDGDDFVRAILAQRPASTYITRKLYSFFCKELPPAENFRESDLDPAIASALRQFSATLLEARYDLKPLLRRMFLSEHFYSAAFLNEQIKSPVELVVGAARSLLVPVRDLGILNDALDLMGQSLFMPPSVKGWDGGRSWVNTSTMFVRQNIMAYLLTGKKPVGYDPTADSQKYDPMSLLENLASAQAGADRDPDQVAEYLLRLCLGHAPDHAVNALRIFARTSGNSVTRDMVVGMLLLITAMPDYQLC